jgi:bifunctional non-homologous end joining protein LigD
VAEVSFVQWTRDGNLRHAAFVGLREDKRAADVRPRNVTQRGHLPSRVIGKDGKSYPATGQVIGSSVFQSARSALDRESVVGE